MHNLKYLLALSTFLSATLLVPSAAANMLINYKTNLMNLDRETSIEQWPTGPSEWSLDSYFFEGQSVAFDVSFITPDFQLVVKEPKEITFYDPAITIVPSTAVASLFTSADIDKGSFIKFYLSPDSVPFFSFQINFSTTPAADGMTRSATWTSDGNLNPVYGDFWNFDQFTLHQNHWSYQRHDQVWVFDTTARFGGDNLNIMTINKIPTPEPYTASLLFLGLAGIFVVRDLQAKRK